MPPTSPFPLSPPPLPLSPPRPLPSQGQLMEHYSQSEIRPEDTEWEELMEEVCRVREEEEEEDKVPFSPQVLEGYSPEAMVRTAVR